MGEHAISQRSVTDRIPIKLQLTGKSREGSHKTSTQNPYSVNVYILLDVLLCSITDWFFLGQDFSIRTVSVETVKSCVF